MPHPRIRTPVEQLQPFQRDRTVAGWTYRRIAAHVEECCCFQQWSVEHSKTRRPGSGRPYSTDTHQNQRIMRASVPTRIASREEIWAHVAPAVSPMTISNRLLAAGIQSCVSFFYNLYQY